MEDDPRLRVRRLAPGQPSVASLARHRRGGRLRRCHQLAHHEPRVSVRSQRLRPNPGEETLGPKHRGRKGSARGDRPATKPHRRPRGHGRERNRRVGGGTEDEHQEGRGGPAGRARQGPLGRPHDPPRRWARGARGRRARGGETVLDEAGGPPHASKATRRRQRRAHRAVDEQHHVVRHARARLPAHEAREDGTSGAEN